MLQGRTLWELMEQRVDATPDALLAVDEDMRTLTFAELWSEAERTAAGLMAAGVRAGDVVSWQLPTWIESLVLAVGLSRLGVVQNPLLPILSEREVGIATERTDARLLVVPSSWQGRDYESMATAVAERQHRGMRVLVADKALPQGDPTQLPAPPRTIDAADQAVRWVFYTSGATADPRGVQHTDGTIAAAARALVGRLAVIDADRAAVVFPITHIAGMVWLFAALQTGCGLILTETFDPATAPEVLAREGVTLAGCGTVFHEAYVAEQRRSLHPLFPNVRAFPGGGAPKPASIVEEVRALFDVPVLSGYGLTEAPVLTMADVADADADLAVSEGRPVPGVELRIVDPDGAVVAPGGEGEIRARAPQMMLGYLDPLADLEAFDGDGWFCTGDLGRLDERGNLIVTGRLDDVIAREGGSVSAREIEERLSTHARVAEAAVIVVPDPDAGERVCAVVRTADGTQDLTFDEMVDHLGSEGLQAWQLPDRLEIVAALPRGHDGSVRKHVLRDEFKG